MIWVYTISIGSLLGFLYEFVASNNETLGLRISALVGACGSLVTLISGRLTGYYQGNEPAGLLAVILGATALILISNLVFLNRKH